MKNIITDEITKKLATTLNSTVSANMIFGDAIELNGEQYIPVAKVVINLSADAEGGGSGNAGLKSSFTNMAKGGGEGKAESGVKITVEPVGLVSSKSGEPTLIPLDCS